MTFFGFVLLAFACGGCASTYARGVGAGRPLDLRAANGRYCNHCGGGPEWSVTFPGDGPDHPSVQVVTKGGTGEVPLMLGDSMVYVRTDDKTIYCRKGELRIVELTEERLTLTFHADCDDGGHVEGEFRGPLSYSSGYD